MLALERARRLIDVPQALRHFLALGIGYPENPIGRRGLFFYLSPTRITISMTRPTRVGHECLDGFQNVGLSYRPITDLAVAIQENAADVLGLPCREGHRGEMRWRYTQVMIRFVSLVAVLALVGGCGGSNPVEPTPPTAPFTQVDLVDGTGATATAGQTVTVTYALWLYDPNKADGKGTQIPQPSTPFTFVLGTGRVIRGWDLGVVGMKVGGQRRLTIPPELAYGSSGSGGSIPPNATLVFDITLTAVQ